MADLKISELTSATTPLAGTEVLPIVQAIAAPIHTADVVAAYKATQVKESAA